MQSKNIVFTGKQQVELRSEEAPALPADGLLARTQVSLISTGTESICYRGEMDEGTHWANWVKYPFYPGYSNVAVVEEVGAAVQGFAPGDRIFSTANHRQIIAVKPPVVKIPASISDEEASWSKLATIAQTAVRRAELRMGAKAVVIGLGPLGQLLVQYARVVGAEELHEGHGGGAHDVARGAVDEQRGGADEQRTARGEHHQGAGPDGQRGEEHPRAAAAAEERLDARGQDGTGPDRGEQRAQLRAAHVQDLRGVEGQHHRRRGAQEQEQAVAGDDGLLF